MQNITELRESLARNYDLMKRKEMSLKEGNSLANVAGKLLGTLKVEMKYCEMVNEVPDIEFLKSEVKKKEVRK